MTRFLLILALLTAPLALTACGGDGAGPVQAVVDPAPEATPTQSASGEPVMEDGVQVVQIESGSLGFQPQQISLQAGVPARFVVTRTVDTECGSQITIPDYDIEPVDLPMNEPVAIDFTPTEAGTVGFVCGMGMQSGTIAVVS